MLFKALFIYLFVGSLCIGVPIKVACPHPLSNGSHQLPGLIHSGLDTEAIAVSHILSCLSINLFI